MTTIRTLNRIAMCCALLAVSFGASAAMRSRPVEWSQGGKAFQGVLVYDDAIKVRRPGLLMVPNWMGVNPAAVTKAANVAGRDYVVLVADVYGRDVRPKNASEAGVAAMALKGNRPELRARMQKALAVLRAQAASAPLDASRVGVFGFCFGGTSALELLRSGADVAGVVTLHAGLDAPMPAASGAVRSPVLVLNGAADKSVPREDVAKFQSEMTQGGADWQFVDFSGAVHCFAEPDAGNDPKSNCRYDARSATRAYRMLRDFFAERFASMKPASVRTRG